MNDDPYVGVPTLPPYHKVYRPKGTRLDDPLHTDPPPGLNMDDTTLYDILCAIRANTEAVREVTAELRGVVELLSRQGSAVNASRRGKVLGGQGGETHGDVAVRATWLTPIAEAYEKEMGAGSFPYGQALKPLSQLRKAGNTEAEIALRIGYYCRHMQRANEVQFMSIPNFAKTFKTWNPREPAFAEDE